MRFFTLILCIALVVPVVADGARLTSVSGSQETRDDFSILALHFDKTVPYTVDELDGGRAMRLNLPDCQADPEAQRRLENFTNRFIRSAELKPKAGGLEIRFNFTRAMKAVVWETNDPFSLVFDFSPASETQVTSKPRTSAASASEPVAAVKQSALEAKTTPESSTSPVRTNPPETQAPTRRAEPQPRREADETQCIVPITPEEHYYEALKLRARGDLQGALSHLEKARLDPGLFARATVEIAGVYHELGRRDAEIAAWERLFAELRSMGLTSPAQEKIWSPTPTFEDAEATDSGIEGESTETGSKWATILIWLLTAAVIGMGFVIFRLYKTIKALQFQMIINAPSPEEDKPGADTEEEEEEEETLLGEPGKPSESEAETVRRLQKDPEPAEETSQDEEEEDDTSGESSWDEMDEEEKKALRSSEETAAEVHALSEQGFSIQEIAEKMKLGQDEVRLILNLQREGEPAEAEA